MKRSFRENHLLAFLNAFDREPKPLDIAFSNYARAHRSIGAHDRRYIGDTAYALIRWKGVLDYLLGKPSSWSERLNLWAAVDINALNPEIPLPIRSGGSEWLFQELSASYGTLRAAELCRELNELAPLTVRANLLKTTREALLSSWQARFSVEPCSQAAAGIRFNKKESLTSLPEFKEGLFEIQDEGSQLVASLVDPQPGEQVLDYCSGSGGKSLAIAPQMKGKGQIYLHDIRPSILIEARRRLRRAGVQNSQTLEPDHPRLASLKNKIDWVLADVPCSGSGTYRRNPDMKWKADRSLLERLAAEQRKIFIQAVSFVRPGGHIVYATCSLFPKENEEQVDYFLKTLPLRLKKPPLATFPEQTVPMVFSAPFFKKQMFSRGQSRKFFFDFVEFFERTRHMLLPTISIYLLS